MHFIKLYSLQYFNHDINYRAFPYLNISLHTIEQCYKSIISNFLYFSKIFLRYFNFEKYNDQNRRSESIFSFENLALNNTNVIHQKNKLSFFSKNYQHDQKGKKKKQKNRDLNKSIDKEHEFKIEDNVEIIISSFDQNIILMLAKPIPFQFLTIHVGEIFVNAGQTKQTMRCMHS